MNEVNAVANTVIDNVPIVNRKDYKIHWYVISFFSYIVYNTYYITVDFGMLTLQSVHLFIVDYGKNFLKTQPIYSLQDIH